MIESLFFTKLFLNWYHMHTLPFRMSTCSTCQVTLARWVCELALIFSFIFQISLLFSGNQVLNSLINPVPPPQKKNKTRKDYKYIVLY